MEIWIPVAAAVLCVAGAVESEGRRSKRNIGQLKSVIEDIVGRSAYDFVNYGCFCGFGGSGKPVDDIDRCCKQHDACYRRITKCNIRFHTYNLEGSGNFLKCGEGTDKCVHSSQLCGCDLKFAHCLKKHIQKFNKSIEC